MGAMTGEIVPSEPSDRSYDEQMRAALEKALEIQGTVLADLEAAINCILQMERALNTVGAGQFNPHEATAQYLKTKYGMNARAAAKSEVEGRKLLDRGKGELVEGKRELVESTDEIADAEVVDD